METWEEINAMRFSGNVIPLSWLKHVTHDNGKPDMVAVMLLSDVMGWYFAQPAWPEDSAPYQRSHTDLAEAYNFTKRQVADAMRRLKTGAFLQVILRTIELTPGRQANNVQYLGVPPGAAHLVASYAAAREERPYDPA